MIALRLVRDLITGLSKRYAFIEYQTFKMALNTYVRCKKLVLKNSEVFVDFECGRLLPGWKPRRLGIYRYICILIFLIKRINIIYFLTLFRWRFWR